MHSEYYNENCFKGGVFTQLSSTFTTRDIERRWRRGRMESSMSYSRIGRRVTSALGGWQLSLLVQSHPIAVVMKDLNIITGFSVPSYDLPHYAQMFLDAVGDINILSFSGAMGYIDMESSSTLWGTPECGPPRVPPCTPERPPWAPQGARVWSSGSTPFPPLIGCGSLYANPPLAPRQ